MVGKVLTLTNTFFTKGNARSVKAKKNIAFSFITKALSIGIGLLLVPLTIHYVNPVQYGIWITLSSIIAWFSFFDIGFGHGLRNKFAESVAKGKYKLARVYVSTTYAILGLLSLGAMLLFLILNKYLNWSVILNAPSDLSQQLSILALIVFYIFCIQFVLQLIVIVLTADQQPAKASFFKLLGSICSLIAIYILTKTTTGNLLYLGCILGAMPVIVLLLTSIWFYTHEYKRYSPSFKLIKFSFAKDLIGIGSKFFIIQMGVLILYQTDNIVIAQLLGANEVTKYNVAYKLFSTILMCFTIIVTPFWSAYTDAYVRNDMEWIKKSLRKFRLLWILIIIAAIMLVFAAPYILPWWIGDNFTVPANLLIALALYIIAYTWHTMHVYLINGIGKIKLQLYMVIISSLINIPLAIVLGKKMGLAGISLANTILFIIMGVVLFIQTEKIINKSASGIWDA